MIRENGCRCAARVVELQRDSLDVVEEHIQVVEAAYIQDVGLGVDCR
jgi:hypothetical protein